MACKKIKTSGSRMWECSMWQPGWKSCVRLTENYRVASVMWNIPWLGGQSKEHIHIWLLPKVLVRKVNNSYCKGSDNAQWHTHNPQIQTILTHPQVSPLMFCCCESKDTELALRLQRPCLSPWLVSDNSRMQHTLPCPAFWAVLQLHLGQGAKEACARWHFQSHCLVWEAVLHQTSNYPVVLLTELAPPLTLLSGRTECSAQSKPFPCSHWLSLVSLSFHHSLNWGCRNKQRINQKAAGRSKTSPTYSGTRGGEQLGKQPQLQFRATHLQLLPVNFK